jgi:tellurite resistance protein
VKPIRHSLGAEVGLCILFAAVDGEISTEEVGALSSRVGQLVGDDFEPMRLPALLDAELAQISRDGVDAYVESLRVRIPEERRYEAVRAACIVAGADGLADEEEQMIRQVCTALELEADELLLSFALPEGVHDDAPDETTEVIRSRLVDGGWIDPMKDLRDAGVGLSGFGALALQYPRPNGHLLRLEHHTCDGSIHFHVTDEADEGDDFVIFANGHERDVIDIVVAMQNSVTPQTLAPWVQKLQLVARVCAFDGETLVDLAASDSS